MNEAAAYPTTESAVRPADQMRQYPPPSPVPNARSLNDNRRKSPFLACVLSLMPGLGQVYVGYYQRGFIHVAVAAIAISLLASGGLGALIPLVGVFLAFFWLYNMVDAWRRAALYNYALEGGSEIELPEDLRVPGFRGSLAGGVTLVIIGLVLLANTRFGMSLAWIEDWWPLAIVAFGGYLVYRAVRAAPASA